MRKNKINILSVLFFLLLMFSWDNASAQCKNCSYDGALNPSNIYVRPAYAPEWTTVRTNDVAGRDYMLFNVTKGEIYRWTTYGTEDDVSGLDEKCADDDDCPTGQECIGMTGSKTCELAFNTQLTLLGDACGQTGTSLAYNLNGLYRNQSMIEWKATFSGTVYLLVNQYDCMSSCDIDGLNCLTTSVKWQRIDSSSCSECSYQYPTYYMPPDPEPTTPAGAFSSPTSAPSWTITADEDMISGEFQTFTVEKGKIYRWTTCKYPAFCDGSTPCPSDYTCDLGNNVCVSNIDTQLTLFRGNATEGNCGQFLKYSDDSPNVGNCPPGSKQTVLEWQSDFDGNVSVLLNKYNCSICGESQNPNNPWGHCTLSTLEWQRYDCHECIDGKGTFTPDEDLNSVTSLEHGDYIKFNLKKGGQYVFRSVSSDTTTTFTGLLTLRKADGSACYGEVLAQSTQVSGSYVQQIVFTAVNNMTVELLISGENCSAVTGKSAEVTYKQIYDPDGRFHEYEDDNEDTWYNTIFDEKTQTVFFDIQEYTDNWQDAIDLCENYEFTDIEGGGTSSDWWLPALNFLYPLVDFNLYDPATSADIVSYVTDTSGEGGNCGEWNATEQRWEPSNALCSGYPKYICGEELTCVRNNWFWSATTVYGAEEFAWGVNMMGSKKNNHQQIEVN